MAGTKTTSRTAGDIDRGWAWLVLVAVYCGIVILSTSAFMSGVLYVALLDRYGGDKAKTSLVGSLNTGLLCLLGPFASVVMETMSCRVAIVVGGFLLSLSCLLSAFINSIDWLIVTYGVIGGVGNALASTSYVVVLGYYFEKRRNRVISLSVAVVGIGMFIASPIALSILDTFGLHGTYLMLSAINAHICLVGVVCKPSSTEICIHKRKNIKASHEYTGVGPSAKLKHKNRCTEQLTNNFKQISDKFSFDVLNNLPLVLFMFSTLTWNAMLATCLMHLPNYVSVKGARAVEITVVMTCFSVSNAIGRFLSALTVDRRGLDSMKLHIVMLAFAGLVTITFPFYSYLPLSEYIFAAMVGLLTGGPNSLMTPITLSLTGVDKLSAAHGYEYFFSGIGFVLGPPVVGALYEHTGTYASSFFFAGSVVLMGGLLAVVALFKRPVLSKSDNMVVTVVEVEEELAHEEKLLARNCHYSKVDDKVEIVVTG